MREHEDILNCSFAFDLPFKSKFMGDLVEIPFFFSIVLDVRYVLVDDRMILMAIINDYY